MRGDSLSRCSRHGSQSRRQPLTLHPQSGSRQMDAGPQPAFFSPGPQNGVEPQHQDEASLLSVNSGSTLTDMSGQADLQGQHPSAPHTVLGWGMGSVSFLHVSLSNAWASFGDLLIFWSLQHCTFLCSQGNANPSSTVNSAAGVEDLKIIQVTVPGGDIRLLSSSFE